MGDALALVVNSALVAVAARAALDFARHGGGSRFDVAGAIGSLAPHAAYAVASSLTGVQLPSVETATLVVLLAQPCFMVRLAAHVRAVPPAVKASVALAAALSAAFFVAFPLPLPPAGALVVVSYVGVSNAWAATAFVRSAAVTTGMRRARLQLVATASILLAVVVSLRGLAPLVPAAGEPLLGIAGPLGAVVVLAWFLGFVPPASFRLVWQRAESYSLMAGVSGLEPDERVARTVSAIPPIIEAVTGGAAAGVALGTPDAALLRWQPGTPATFGRTVAAADGVIGRALAQRRAIVAPRTELGAEESRIAAAHRASDAYVVPLVASGRPRGVLLVLLRRDPLFADDDLVMLRLIADQAAVAVEQATHLAEQRALVDRLRVTNSELMRAHARSERLTDLGTRVAKVAHEVNNPLQFMRGNLEIAAMDVRALRDAGDTPGAVKDALAGVDALLADATAAAERVVRITQNLKAAARAGASDRAVVDVGPAIDQVVKLVRAGTPPGTRLVAHAPASPVRVVANPEEIVQVLLNLAKNAVEAIGDRGGRVEISVRGGGDAAEIVVADDGPGIRPDVRSRLFQAPITTKPSGTGLGLPIVREIVERHGGSVRVESDVGKGATFIVSLPTAREATDDPRPSAAAARAPAPAA